MFDSIATIITISNAVAFSIFIEKTISLMTAEDPDLPWNVTQRT